MPERMLLPVSACDEFTHSWNEAFAFCQATPARQLLMTVLGFQADASPANFITGIAFVERIASISRDGVLIAPDTGRQTLYLIAAGRRSGRRRIPIY